MTVTIASNVRARLSILAVSASAAAITACAATPAYPVSANDSPQSVEPRYPIRSIQAPEISPATAVSRPRADDPDPPKATGVAAPQPVESQTLPPVYEPQAAPTQASPPASPPPSAYQSRAYEAPARPVYVTRTRPGPERVVAGGRVVRASRMYRDYEIRRGDHLDVIARDLEVDPRTLIEANHLKSPNNLRPGQHLKAPIEKAYEAEGGDTLADVAKRFEVSAASLADLNNLSPRARLHAGDRIALPAGIHDRGAIRVPGAMIVERVEAPPTRIVRGGAGAYAQRSQSELAAQISGAPYTPSPQALAEGEAARVEQRQPPPPRIAYATPRGGYTTTPYAPQTYPSQPYTPQTAGHSPGSNPVTDSEIAAAGRGRFVWPVRGEILTPFGAQGVGRRNDGVDLRSPEGAVVRAAAAGDVVYAGDQVPGFGNLVLVKHADGWVTAYAHLERTSVQMRQSVMQGQEIGEVGTTGGVAEPQLHFEIRYAPTPTDKARPVNPMLVMPAL